MGGRTGILSGNWVLALFLAFGTPGCAGVVAGAMVSHSINSKARQEFQYRFDERNERRMQDSLPPLDFCSECFWFDRGWAYEDAACAKRIRRFEHGDSTAIEPRGMRSARTVPVVSDSVQLIYDRKAGVAPPGW